MKNFNEAQLEKAVIESLGKEGIPHKLGKTIKRAPEEVLIKDDLKAYLLKKYASEKITVGEIAGIIKTMERLPASDLYYSNKTIMEMVREGFSLKREDKKKKDFWVYLIDYSVSDHNIYKIVNQLEITGNHPRIPDGILYINGLPLVVFEFKSAVRAEEATIYKAWEQLTIRYKRDIPELFKYNAFCVISDAVQNKAGSFFAPYDFFYGWRRIEGMKVEANGIDTLHTMITGMFNKKRLRDIIQNFIYFPDSSKKDSKILCRYPQYYAAKKLYASIKAHQKPGGDGKGGTYFGATGSGKSFTMLYLSRLLMKSTHFNSPTIILITDRNDLDDQLSGDFTNAKEFIGDENVLSVKSRNDLKTRLKGIKSGGVFLTTIQKFAEGTDLLTDRSNVICISDEAHRSQTNLEQKIKVKGKKVVKTFGFAKYLHDALPNATYVGFSGTPIDATLKVFGNPVDAYTMQESVEDGITVKIVYEGRAAKVLLKKNALKKIETYYNQCAEVGSNQYQIEESKNATSKMNAILGNPERLKAIAADFIAHYENRITEGASVCGKAMFVCSSRPIAYQLFKLIVKLRPEWNKVLSSAEGVKISAKDKKEIKPMQRIKMIMTREQDDEKELHTLLGPKEYRKELDRQFKNEKSNFKIAIVVDMWLTGFDVPFLDTMYIDKPIQEHNLIQTISRVNRTYKGKNKGLIVDYIGIKKHMKIALKRFSKVDKSDFEDVSESIIAVKNHLDLLKRMFIKFDSKPYFSGSATAQLKCLNAGSEFVLQTKQRETRFMALSQRLKMAYDICCVSDEFTPKEKDLIHFYFAIRSIVYKLTKGEAPDTAQMNAKVNKMIEDALKSDGIEEIFKIGEEEANSIDLFTEDFLEQIDKIKLPNTKIKVLQKLLAKAIDDFKKVNKIKGTDFTKKMEALVKKYNERKEADVLRSDVLKVFTKEILDLVKELKKEQQSFKIKGIDFEEKAFYDILKSLTQKYDFKYAEKKLIDLAKKVKIVVADKTKYPGWDKRDDILNELISDIIVLLDENGYPPIKRDEVYDEIIEQAKNFKKYNKKD